MSARNAASNTPEPADAPRPQDEQDDHEAGPPGPTPRPAQDDEQPQQEVTEADIDEEVRQTESYLAELCARRQEIAQDDTDLAARTERLRMELTAISATPTASSHVGPAIGDLRDILLQISAAAAPADAWKGPKPPPTERELCASAYLVIKHIGASDDDPIASAETPEHRDALERRPCQMRNASAVKQKLTLSENCPTLALKMVDCLSLLVFVF
ncbi:hypothetical protein HDU88_005122 [Geranomyces variabilis]|nr:hypothetical protein HDU88_005122 [Geranomyces variabilis]